MPVHFTVTLWLAEVAGFDPGKAFEVAKYDQATDDDPATQPLPDWNSPGYERRKLYHFVDGRRIQELRKKAEACDPEQMGLFLHAYEDLFSHRDFDSALGHISGHTPDKPWTKPGDFKEMVHLKLDELRKLALVCKHMQGQTPNKAAENFDRSRTALDGWARDEVQAGVGHPGSPKRWDELLPKLYADRYQAYKNASIDYGKWIEQRKREGWKP